MLLPVELSEAPNEQCAPGKIEAQAMIGERGRLVVPAAVREALGLKPGDTVDMRIEDHELRISTRWGRMKRAQERARRHFEPDRSLSDELSAERRKAALSE